jgi:hypothetical protein
LKSGTETLKSIWFLVFRTTFWQFFSLLWEIFVNIFRTTGFSTVSLGVKVSALRNWLVGEGYNTFVQD